MKYTYPLNHVNNRTRIMNAAEHHLLSFDQKDMAEWLTGSRKRFKAVEYHFPRLVAEQKLLAVRYGRKLVYRLACAHPDGTYHLEHDLMCTKIILRFGTLEEVEIVSELFFQEEKERFGCVPDWAVLFPSIVLLCEFSTSDNFRRTRLMQQKLRAYRRYLSRFADYFERDVLVLFVLDAPRNKVQQFVETFAVPDDTFAYFTDLASLMAIPKVELLNATLFIWGGDGQSYGLTS